MPANPEQHPDLPYPQPRPSSLPRLLWILTILLIVLILPSIVERVQYSLTRGHERAVSEIARANLPNEKLDAFSDELTLVPKAVGPSVVHIDTVRVVSNRDTDELAQMYGQPERQYEARGQGSGVIVDAAGYVVTNNHVIEGAGGIEVSLSDGRTFQADVVGVDPLTDLAVLKIDAGDLTPTDWGDSDKLEAGSLVFAIGNPFGLDRSVTLGIISAKGRRTRGASVYQDFLQTDAAINPGNSGGPLINVEGKIVGINTAIIGRAYQGVGFSIPSNTAREVYEKLKKEGSVERGWLAVLPTDVSPQVAKKLGLNTVRGALIERVVEGGPADKAGIQAGDFVTEWDGHPVDDAAALAILVGKTPIGKKAQAKLIRDGREMTIDVEVERRPRERPLPQ